MNARTWQEHLATALNTQDPEVMKKALANVPPQHLQLTLQAIKDQGHAHYQRGAFAEAVEAYNQILSLGTKDYFVLLHRTHSLLQLQRLDEAYQAGLQLVALHGEYHRAFRLLAQICEARKDQDGMLEALQKASALDPKDKQLAEQVRALEVQVKEKQDLLNRVLNPDQAGAEQAPELPPLPDLAFDPALYSEPGAVEANENMRKGLISFLQSFGELDAPRELIQRIEDPHWIATFARVLERNPGKRWAIVGPEAGLLPLIAMASGASSVACWDEKSMTRRLSEGHVQKRLIGDLQRDLGADWLDKPKEERQQDFEGRAKPYQMLAALEAELPGDFARCDGLLFTRFEHDPLSRNLIPRLRRLREQVLSADAKIFPSRLRVYACPIQWDLACAGFSLEKLADYHWHPFALQVTADSGPRRLLAAPQLVLDQALAELECGRHTLNFPITEKGRVHGLLYWYSLELDDEMLDTGPEGNLAWPGQAFQYVDTRKVNPGDALDCTLEVREDRLFFQTVPAIAAKRAACLAPWHIHGATENAFNASLVTAVREAVAQHRPKRVLNIGAGNGLLALAAAAEGAQVIACETSPLLCEALIANAEAAGLSDRITVVNEDCRKLTIPEHLPAKADMVVFDKFDCGLLGDGILHYLEPALANLVAEGATILPHGARMEGMLIERRIEEVAGQHAVLLTPYLFSPEYIHVQLPRLRHRRLSAPFSLFSFDFGQAKVGEEEKQFTVELSESGISGAVVFWYELDLGEGRSLSTSPLSGQTDRGQALQYLPEIRLAAGDKLGFKVKHTGSNIMFGIDPETVDKEKILALPRFDPNWLNGHRNAMHQSGQIMQQLRMNPAEYAKAFALACQYAIAPGSHDLDANVAARFLHMFL